MRLLFIGDIVGTAGVKIVQQHLPLLIEKHQIDFTVANGENAAHGFGLNKRGYNELHACGVDCFTLGNHTWDCKEIFSFIDSSNNIIRPANYPPGLPGVGFRRFEVNGRSLLVINLIGRVFMQANDCPFRCLDKILAENKADWAFVDIHADATSEKIALAWYADGRISAMAGSHTHVQTADARLLNRGTGYITDAGMTGPRDSVLGVDREIIIRKFLTGASARFETAAGDVQLNAVLFDLADDGTCRSVEPINLWEPGL